MGNRPLLQHGLEAVAVAIAAFFYLAIFQYQTANLSEPDVYYHIKTAWLMRTHGVLDVFPWAEASLWREAYFNKDFGFHVLLIPFTFGDLVAGAKLAALCFGALIYTSFYLVLRRNRVRYAWLWTVLLACSGGYFGYRANVARPQVLSIILALWGMHFVIRQSRIGVSATGFFYSLSYTAPHVLVGFAGVRWLAGGFCERRWRPDLWLVALGGVLAGSLLHPNFPNNFSGWWVQLGGVLSSSWGGAESFLGLGGELRPADTRSFLREHALIYVLAAAAILLWSRTKAKMTPELWTLLVVANGYLVLACLSKRFTEYFVPFSLWLLAALFSHALPRWSECTRRAKIAGASAVALLVVTTGLYTARGNLENAARYRPSGAVQGALWLRQNTPVDSLVFTCDWDDAPELFFFNHRNHYLVFLDPSYMYRWRPILWRAWRRVAMGQEPDPVRVIRDGFRAAAGYCTGEYVHLRRQLEADPRVKLAGRQGGAYAFVFIDAQP